MYLGKKFMSDLRSKVAVDRKVVPFEYVTNHTIGDRATRCPEFMSLPAAMNSRRRISSLQMWTSLSRPQLHGNQIAGRVLLHRMRQLMARLCRGLFPSDVRKLERSCRDAELSARPSLTLC
jgi:hypothetical protein